MNTSSTALLTVDEAREWAEAHPDKKYELHNGQMIEMAPPKYDHRLIQRKLFVILFSRLQGLGEVHMECDYRGTPEYDARTADVGVISAERHHQAVSLNERFGAPELAIEVVSPSNRPGEMQKRQDFCFAHGTQVFWVVNLPRRIVTVTTASGNSQTFHEGGHISLEPFASDTIAVNDIFS